MYCLSVFCGVCLKTEELYHTILNTNNDDAQILHKLHTCSYLTDFLDNNASFHICHKCFDRLQDAYKFIGMCRNNSDLLRGYIANLRQDSASPVQAADIIMQNDIKEEEDASQCLKPELVIDLTLNSGELVDEEDEIFEEKYTGKEEIVQTERFEQNNNVDDCTRDHLDPNHTQMYCKPIINEGPMLKQEEQCTVKEEILTDSRHDYLKIKFELLSDMDTDVGSIVLQQPSVSNNNGDESSSNDESFKIKCNTCGIFFASEDHLKTHELIHVAKMKYPCTVCEKSFTQFNHLNIHIRTHFGEKNFQCIMCERIFIQFNELTTHMRIHTDEKKHPCT